MVITALCAYDAKSNWATFNQRTGMFQVGSVDGAGSNATLDYTNFAAGAQTDAVIAVGRRLLTIS
ncbi:MAG TPA: hypothetical protein VGM27_18150 [Acidobacteriaceae bacterium]